MACMLPGFQQISWQAIGPVKTLFISLYLLQVKDENLAFLFNT